MPRTRSSVSKAGSYREMGDFWDAHDLSGFWDQTHEADIESDIETEVVYYALDGPLSRHIESVARKRGVSADALFNLWVQEKLQSHDVQIDDAG